MGVIVFVLVFAAAGSRLLGVRLSLRRVLLTGPPGLAAGGLFGFLVNRYRPGHITLGAAAASDAAGLVATMLLMVLTELLVSALLLLAPRSRSIATELTLLQLFGYIGLFFSLTLIFSVVLDILGPGRDR